MGLAKSCQGKKLQEKLLPVFVGYKEKGKSILRMWLTVGVPMLGFVGDWWTSSQGDQKCRELRLQRGEVAPAG